MILAATDWLSISINLLLVVFVLICLLMTVMILMQRPKQEGLGAAFGGGMTDQMFGARTTNVLQRGTVWFASLFFLLALTLAVLIGIKNSRSESLLASKDAAAADAGPATPSPQTEEPVVETIRNLIEEPSPAGEPAPSGEAGPDAEPADDGAQAPEAPSAETAPEEASEEP